MAQELHDIYDYSYDNLKVLLGGWSAWLSAGYPIGGLMATPAATTEAEGAGLPAGVTTPVTGTVTTP